MEAGRTNVAKDETRIWAARTDSDDCDDFNGQTILIVEVARDIHDPEDYCNNDFKHQHPINGIVGSGWSSNVILFRNIDAVGVIGNGGANQGTGVLGKGAAYLSAMKNPKLIRL
ncbi:hypothetical protein [Bacillus pseudomycoides]|uniref:hypothetical protein n=1 Tax=Bacillus pseudomycoides TaxID=64104 RepID=UPI001FB3327F|nr:hypothetical protein [Bacillus pseudomycoides]